MAPTVMETTLGAHAYWVPQTSLLRNIAGTPANPMMPVDCTDDADKFKRDLDVNAGTHSDSTPSEGMPDFEDDDDDDESSNPAEEGCLKEDAPFPINASEGRRLGDHLMSMLSGNSNGPPKASKFESGLVASAQSFKPKVSFSPSWQQGGYSKNDLSAEERRQLFASAPAFTPSNAFTSWEDEWFTDQATQSLGSQPPCRSRLMASAPAFMPTSHAASQGLPQAEKPSEEASQPQGRFSLFGSGNSKADSYTPIFKEAASTVFGEDLVEVESDSDDSFVIQVGGEWRYKDRRAILDELSQALWPLLGPQAVSIEPEVIPKRSWLSVQCLDTSHFPANQCWNLVTKGHCPRGKACRWAHVLPEVVKMDLEVMYC